jgi:riboflavin synthase
MFTGLIQCVGKVTRFQRDGSGGAHLDITASDLKREVELGDSIAIDGVCLTVVEFKLDRLTFQTGPETLQRTTLGDRVQGDSVNLEPALCMGDALGGHLVTGHVDAVGRIQTRIESGDWQTIWFEFPGVLQDLIVEKGSIAIDGISLTVVAVEALRFSVMLIPHTLTHTTMGKKATGSRVNLETDLIAKHVQNLARPYLIGKPKLNP